MTDKPEQMAPVMPPEPETPPEPEEELRETVRTLMPEEA